MCQYVLTLGAEYALTYYAQIWTSAVEIERVVVPQLIMVSFKLTQILFVFWQKSHFQHTFWSNFTATQSLTLSQYCMKPE